MGQFERINSGCFPVWFRSDLRRAEAQSYWRDRHGPIVSKVPAIHEYLQHHFSPGGHGFWPVPAGVGGAIPPDWQMDGLTEVRMGGLLAGLSARLFHMKEVFHDEQNVFDRVVPNLTNIGGGRWWTSCYRPEVGFRAIVLLRARHGVGRAAFRSFVEETLASALMAAGATELRTHVFLRGGRFIFWTPGVRHDEPANRRYAAALVIGAKDRAEFDALMTSSPMQSTEAAQLRHCVAIHAYAVENTYPLVLNGEPQAST